jgi:hypothetical protein
VPLQVTSSLDLVTLQSLMPTSVLKVTTATLVHLVPLSTHAQEETTAQRALLRRLLAHQARFAALATSMLQMVLAHRRTIVSKAPSRITLTTALVQLPHAPQALAQLNVRLVIIVQQALEDQFLAQLVLTRPPPAVGWNLIAVPVTRATTVPPQPRAHLQLCSACKVSTVQLAALCRTPMSAHLETNAQLVVTLKLLARPRTDTKMNTVRMSVRTAQLATTARTPRQQSAHHKMKERATTAPVVSQMWALVPTMLTLTTSLVKSLVQPVSIPSLMAPSLHRIAWIALLVLFANKSQPLTPLLTRSWRAQLPSIVKRVPMMLQTVCLATTVQREQTTLSHVHLVRMVPSRDYLNLLALAHALQVTTAHKLSTPV